MAKEDKIPKKVIFIYSESALERKLRKVMTLSKYRHGLGTNGAFKSRNFITSDKKLLIVKLPIGAPATATALEEAVACGGREFLILGIAGGINQKLQISDLVLCDRAIRDEGTSHHYIKESKYAFPDKKLTLKLENMLARDGMQFYKGTTWSIDTPYAETKEEINHYRHEGVLTVEMEAAALFAVAKRRNVKAAALFVISDLLGREWSGFKDSDYKVNGYKKLARIARIFKEA